jgi:glycosyltransferase involved in cell wall biosynthesis
VKELSSLSVMPKYRVEVIYFLFDLEKTKFDEEIISRYPNIKFRPIYWYRNTPSRVLGSTMSKLFRIIHQYFKICIWPEQQIFPGYLKLLRQIKKSDAALYHGHNLGSLAAIVKVAKRKNKKVIFDAEDFHRGEASSLNLMHRLTLCVENKYISKLDTLISASPLITKEYQKLYQNINHVNINNVFDINTHKKTVKSKFELNCVWFSQVVGLDRGLQDIIKAINEVKIGSIKLDIIGSVDEHTKYTLLSLNKNPLHEINFILPLSPTALDSILVNYEIGIASETSPNYNREICLTNKIFQYITAGLAILASNTHAQANLMEETPGIGFVYPRNNHLAINKILCNWITNKELLRENQNNAKSISTVKYNWQVEQMKFLDTLENVI